MVVNQFLQFNSRYLHVARNLEDIKINEVVVEKYNAFLHHQC